MTTLTWPARTATPDPWKHDGANKSAAADGRLRTIAEIKAALKSAGYPSLRGVQVSITSGGILLLGTVSRFFMKPIAQAIALRAGRGADVCNVIQVADARSHDAACRAND
jgi:hypothetical protein